MSETSRDGQFRNNAQRECYQRVSAFMRDAFGDQVVADADRPSFRVSRGSAAVQTTVYAFERDAVVHSRARVVRGAQREAPLLELLLRQNAKLVYGAFAIDGDGDIVFIHATPAAAVTREGLQRQITSMLEVADHFDDFITGQWGGEREVDRW
jgi:hypothetical protein